VNWFLKTRLGLAAIFFITASVASLVYWGMWEKNPDYFIVQGEVNLYPLTSVDDFLWNNTLTTTMEQTKSLGDLVPEANRLILEARRLREQRSTLQVAIASLEEKSKELDKAMEYGRAKNIEKYKRNELEAMEADRANYLVQIEAYEKQISNAESNYDPRRIVIADMRVELARKDVRLAQRRYEIANQIAKEYGSFAKPEDTVAWKSVYDEIERTEAKLNAADLDNSKLREQAFELVGNWRKERISRLGIVDFAYFSLGVATTTTFGDIVPNHSLTRFVVTIQLLISVLVVGLFVNLLSK
jgi:Ion channel